MIIKKITQIIHTIFEFNKWFKQQLTTSQKIIFIFLILVAISSIAVVIYQLLSFANNGIYYKFIVSIFFGVVFQAIRCYKNSKDVYIFSPVLYSFEYLALSVFIFNLIILFLNCSSIGSLPGFSIDLNTSVILSIMMILSTLASYVILKQFLDFQDEKKYEIYREYNNNWFDFSFYSKSANTIAAIFTSFAFITLLSPESLEKYVFSIVGTIICFYALIINLLDNFYQYFNKKIVLK